LEKPLEWQIREDLDPFLDEIGMAEGALFPLATEDVLGTLQATGRATAGDNNWVLDQVHLCRVVHAGVDVEGPLHGAGELLA
jgi:hypothetical protein